MLSLIAIVAVFLFILLLYLNGSIRLSTEGDIFKNLIEYYYSFQKWVVDSNAVPFVLAFVPGILGISFPLIIQTISKLNDKYQSTHIVNTFKGEFLHKRFILSLEIAAIASVLSLVDSPLIVLLSISTVAYLLYVFFRYIKLLLVYQDPNELFIHLNKQEIPRNNSSIDIKEARYLERVISSLWHPIIDLLQYSISKNDKKLYFDINDNFIYKVLSFYKYGPFTGKEILKYPEWILNSTYDIVITGIKNDEDNYYKDYESFVGSVLFDQSYSELSKYRDYDSIIYLAIWRNLKVLIENNKSSRIIQYWQSAHQHWQYRLREPVMEFDNNFLEKGNSKFYRELIKRNREKALEFHTAIGAYLMHKGNYRALNDIWFFTQSQPPSYILVPIQIDEIFWLYFHFYDDDPSGNNFLIRYWFKDVPFDSMNNVIDVKSIVRKYLCLLFVKQWITPTWHGDIQVPYPKIPESQSGKNEWADKLPFIEMTVEKFLNDQTIRVELGINQITHSYCRKRGLIHPTQYFEILKDKIKKGFETSLNEQPLSASKVKLLDDYTIDKTRFIYNTFNRISGNEVTVADRDVYSARHQVIRGTRSIINKEAFVDNTSVDYMNFHSIFGEEIVRRYLEHISFKFFNNCSVRYEVPNGRLFEAIDKLNLNAETDVIIAFNTNIQYLKDFKGIDIETKKGDEDYRYKSIPIYEFHGASRVVDNTYFILKKVDLPMIKHKNWTEITDMTDEVKQRWNKMTLIDESLKLYRVIYELNKDKQMLKQLIEEGKKEEELKNKLFIDFDFLGYCWFKSGFKMISINEGNLFKEGGKNDMDKIVPLN